MEWNFKTSFNCPITLQHICLSRRYSAKVKLTLYNPLDEGRISRQRANCEVSNTEGISMSQSADSFSNRLLTVAARKRRYH